MSILNLANTLIICVFSGGILTFSLLHAHPQTYMVMEAQNGRVLASRNAEARLHPASLTKMMTLYLLFQDLKQGRVTLEMQFKVSHRAAHEPPSRLGLHAGQTVSLDTLMSAVAIKSANDASTAIGEALARDHSQFIERMNQTAQTLGMNQTTFKNAHGLTEEGHLSTAHDMTTLGRHLWLDFPEYCIIFSQKNTHFRGRHFSNTNLRFLNDYQGADGIKTGYTSAARFNLVASATRRGKRLIVTLLGAQSSAARLRETAQLLDQGFTRLKVDP